jgi:ribonuclease HI
MDANLPRGTAIMPPLVEVHFDGSCQPPHRGVAGYGFTIHGEGLDYTERGLAAPPHSERSTNNVAEYIGAIRALEHLRSRGFHGQVILMGDSELVIKQLQGEYEVRSEHLKAYHQHLKMLLETFPNARIEWIPREQNEEADALSKLAVQEASRSARRYRSEHDLPNDV